MKYLSILLGLSVASISVAAEPRSFTAEDMVTFKRVGAATLSPDGETVAYQLRTTDLEADRGRYDIYTVSSTGGEAQQITKHAAADTSPTWSADGKKLYFLSSRTGSSQLHSYDFKSQSIEQVTDFPVGVDTFKLSSDNNHIVFSATVFPECETLICSKENFDKRAKQKATGKLYNKTFVRHWDQWLDGTQSRLFSAKLTQNVATATGLSHALNGNVPSRPFGGAEEYTISPDGKTVVFTLRVADEKESRSTNFDLYQVPINGGDITNITQEQQYLW